MLENLATARRTFGCGVELLRSSRRGTVDYAAIPELRGVNLDPTGSRRLQSSGSTCSIGPPGTSAERPLLRAERFGSTIARKPSMSRRFLTLSRLFEIVVLARRAASFRFTCRFTIFVSIQRAMAAKTSEGRLSVHPRHGTDMRGLELLRKFLQYSTPIDSTTNSAGRARAGPANSDIPLSSRARRVWPGHLAVVLGADLLS
jgi:hypothetical protein